MRESANGIWRTMLIILQEIVKWRRCTSITTNSHQLAHAMYGHLRRRSCRQEAMLYTRGLLRPVLGIMVKLRQAYYVLYVCQRSSTLRSALGRTRNFDISSKHLKWKSCGSLLVCSYTRRWDWQNGFEQHETVQSPYFQAWSFHSLTCCRHKFHRLVKPNVEDIAPLISRYISDNTADVNVREEALKCFQVITEPVIRISLCTVLIV